MNWTRGLNEAIGHIEENITESISVDEMARFMNISPYYFQKLFSVLCGCTVGEYIRKRRLTLAGSELYASDKKVIDIALKYGYDTPEGFARAFVRFHGVSPNKVKNGESKPKKFSKLSVSILLKGGENMDYRIEKKKGFKILAKTQRFSKIDNVEGRRDIPGFWDECSKDGTVARLEKVAEKDGVTGGALIGLCMEDSTVLKDFPYSIGCEYRGQSLGTEYQMYDIPEATWAIFDVTGTMPDAIQEIWHRIFTEFFPTSEYRPSGNLDLELYSNGDMSDPNYHSEIWIAVKKK